MGFTGLDYAIVVLYLVGIAYVGIRSAGTLSTAREYFLGGKNIPWWAVCFAIVATETSTLTFISIPGVAYLTNVSFLQVTFGYLLGRIAVSILFLPAYASGDLQTAYAFLGSRFSPRVRNVASTTFMFTRLVADGVRLFATAIPLAILLRGWSTMTWISGNDIYVISIIVMSVITFVYTSIGGVRAVIWTDVVQMFIYLGGAIAAAVVLLGSTGDSAGMTIPPEKFTTIITGFGGSWTEFFSKPYSLAGGILGGAFLSMASHGTDHLIVQRLLTVDSLSGSRKALIGSGIIVIIQFAIFLGIGLLLYRFYDGASLSQLGLLKADEIFPRFIIERIPTGLSGLIIAGLLAAAMSTLSGSVNSLASATMHDLYLPYFGGGNSERRNLRISRIVTFAWSILLLGMAIFFIYNRSPVLVEVALGVASFTYGGLLGLFLLGVLSKNVGELDALFGFAAGIVTMIIVVEATTIGWTWYTIIGSTATVLVGLGVHALFRFARPSSSQS